MTVSEEKRKTIVATLSGLMPEAMQPLVAMFVEKAISNVPDSDLDSLLNDVDTVPDAINSGNMEYLFGICRKYGATDEQINQVAGGGMPLFPMVPV